MYKHGFKLLLKNRLNIQRPGVLWFLTGGPLLLFTLTKGPEGVLTGFIAGSSKAKTETEHPENKLDPASEVGGPLPSVKYPAYYT